MRRGGPGRAPRLGGTPRGPRAGWPTVRRAGPWRARVSRSPASPQRHRSGGFALHRAPLQVLALVILFLAAAQRQGDLRPAIPEVELQGHERQALLFDGADQLLDLLA